jgi:hypothetical protein
MAVFIVFESWIFIVPFNLSGTIISLSGNLHISRYPVRTIYEALARLRLLGINAAEITQV